MARIQRFSVALLLLLLSSVASALVPATAVTWGYGSNGGANGSYPASGYVFYSKEESCIAELPKFENLSQYPGAKFVNAILASDGQSAQCIYSGTRYGAGPTYLRIAYRNPNGSCPANSTASGAQCQCNVGYVEDPTKTSCVAPLSELEQFCKDHAAAKNGFAQAGAIAAASSIPTASCYKPYPPFEGADAEKGCRMTLGDSVGWLGEDGKKHWSSTGVMTGATCEDAAATDEAPKSAADPCPSGFPGTVNGVAKCIAVEPDKGIEGVKGTSQTNADGTKIDSKETTKCVASVCTTTTTTTTTTVSGSTSTSTSSRTESIGDKCEKDPKNKVCQKTQGGAGGATSQMNCEQNASAEGCGGGGAEVGALYAKKDKTFAQVLKKFGDDMRATALGSGVDSFFTVGGGGTCPRVSGVIPFIDKTITIDTFCTDMATAMFLVIKAVLIMLATWMAFRIAFDH